MGKLKLTWNGHSCFTLEENGYAIVLDPYEDGAVPADIADGTLDLPNAAQCVKIRQNRGGAKNPFRITEIHSFHDEEKGTKRGKNTIRIFDDGQYRIAHMGDIGCVPTADQKEQLKGIDVMLMPVGGFFTLEPEDVYALVKELSPRMLVPMHYRGKGFGYDVIAPLEKYTAMCDDVVLFEKNTLSLPEDEGKGTFVLTPPVK